MNLFYKFGYFCIEDLSNVTNNTYTPFLKGIIDICYHCTGVNVGDILF